MSSLSKSGERKENDLVCFNGHTANVYSSITDKLMHLSVASTLKCLFWDFLELCDNYRQISVELPNNKNTQRKNWENFEIMKKK